VKKIIIAGLIMACANTQAIEKQNCIEFLQAGVYNGALEETCGFNGGVKDKLKLVYTNAGCSSIVSPEEIDNTVKDVFKDTRNRYQSLGQKAFCDGNRDSYNALAAQ
jgi:hypothetical protein